MATKAKLTVILMADATLVAESDDTALWQKVLAAIQSGTPLSSPNGKQKLEAPADLEDGGGNGSDKAIGNFARSLNVSVETVTGALSPSREAPYVRLDHHCWAQMKKSTPKRGVGSLSATGLTGTLLALWFKEAKMDVQPTQALAAEVLNTINLKDPNASRGIKNTKWLQGRGSGVVVINAAEITKAIEVARSFCTKQWAEGGKVS